MSAAEALLSRMVDYAGLFPPASLDLPTAVRNYHRYLEGDAAWMLGHFLLPASRLAEFATAFEEVCCTEQEAPWTLSVICAGETVADARAIEQFQQGAIFLRALEVRAADADAARQVLEHLPAVQARFVEFPLEQAGQILPVLAEYGASAKLRLGGVTPASIPPVEAVAQVLLACARERVAFKATAGLHHPIRGRHPLTPEPSAPEATMHGFLNLFLAAALAWFGADEAAVIRTLAEEDPAAFHLDDDVIAWQGHSLIADQLEQVRASFAIGFGSCSFTEPVDDLRTMGWI